MNGQTFCSLTGKEKTTRQRVNISLKFRAIFSHLLKNEFNRIHVLEIWMEG